MTDVRQATCTHCVGKPGYHALRQVGITPAGHPVIYFAFSQCNASWFTSTDTVAHLPTVMWSAAETVEGDEDKFVFILDFSGFGFGSCNPANGKVGIGIFANQFPERLHKVYFGGSPCVLLTPCPIGQRAGGSPSPHPVSPCGRAALCGGQSCVEPVWLLFAATSDTWLA